MRHLLLSLLVLLGGCTAMLLGSGSSAPPTEQSSTGYSADAATTAAVRERFEREPGLAQQAIGVSTYRGRVTLSGTVNSYTERNLAGQIAGAVRGVTSIDNRIRVRVD